MTTLRTKKTSIFSHDSKYALWPQNDPAATVGFVTPGTDTRSTYYAMKIVDYHCPNKLGGGLEARPAAKCPMARFHRVDMDIQMIRLTGYNDGIRV